MPAGVELKVSVTGLSQEPEMTKSIVQNEINENVERWRKFSRLNFINIDVKRHEKGGRTKYSVRIEAGGEGNYHADAHDRILENAAHQALDRLGREVLRKKEKHKKL